MFDDDVSIDATAFGPGETEAAVVGSVHGDEPTGVRAIHRVLGASPRFERAATFVVANPPAAVADRRYLDEDMNRTFPGDPDADTREGRLAAQLVDETADVPTLSIHTTHATPEPVAFVSSGHPRALEVADRLPVKYVVDERPVVDGAFSSTSGVVSVEAGKPERHGATEKAERIVRSFLRVTDVLDGAIEDDSAAEPDVEAEADAASDAAPDTEYFTLDGTVEKPADAESYELLVENFERVEAGTAYAEADGETLVADEPFVPVLVSEVGYDDVFGYRGHEVAESLAGARDAWLDGG